MHIRFVHKYISDGLNFTTVSFSSFGRSFWPDVLGVVVIVLVLVLNHRLDLSDGVYEFSGILMNDLLDVHTLLVLIFNRWGG